MGVEVEREGGHSDFVFLSFDCFSFVFKFCGFFEEFLPGGYLLSLISSGFVFRYVFGPIPKFKVI